MPTYTHQCSECGTENDEMYSLSKFDENAEMTCPSCGEPKYSRQLSAPAFDIKGYCYANEYGKKAWKKNLSVTDQARVVAGDREAY
jgi:putative FmdB family regulatory protein